MGLLLLFRMGVTVFFQGQTPSNLSDESEKLLQAAGHLGLVDVRKSHKPWLR